MLQGLEGGDTLHLSLGRNYVVDQKHAFKEIQGLLICQDFVVLCYELLELLLLEGFVLENISDLGIWLELILLYIAQDVLSSKHLRYLSQLIYVVVSLEDHSLLEDLK